MPLLNLLLPGMGGQIGGLVTDTIDTLESLANCGPENPLACLSAVVDLILVGFDIWQTFFPSRPKVGLDSASDDTALFFIPSANPVIALWGIGIRDLEGLGIPTSASGGSGLAAQNNLANAALADLRRQFDTPGAPVVTLQGVKATGDQVYQWYRILGFDTSNPDSNSTAISERAQVDNLYTQLVTDGWIDPTTGFPFPGKIQPSPPPGGPTPPGGPAPPGGPTPPSPPPGGGDPFQDELQDCCDETQAALAAILQALGALAGGADQGVCCQLIYTALSAQVSALNRIALMVQGLNTGGVNLAPVTAALATIAAELAPLKTIGSPGAPVNVAIENWPPPITIPPPPPPPDLKPLVDAVNAFAKIVDVSPKALQALADQGFISAADLQTLLPGPFGDAIVTIFRKYGWTALVWFFDLIGLTWNGKTFINKPLGETVAADFDKAATGVFDYAAPPLLPFIKRLLALVTGLLVPTRVPVLGDSGVDTPTLLAKTLAPALSLNGLALLFDALHVDFAETITKYVEWASEFAGFEEIKEIEIAQKMQAGPIAAARLQAQNQYRQTPPGAGEVASWTARGIAPVADAEVILGLHGIPNRYHGAIELAATSGISARQLIRLLPTGLFTDADIDDELIFTGMRARSRARYKLVAPFLATSTERSALRSEIESAYAAGLLADADLTGQIDSAFHNTDRDSLLLATAHLKAQIALAKALETEYSTMFQAGLITDAVLRANLEGLGLQAWRVDSIIGVQDARRAATQARQLAAAERALVRATTAEERRAAMKGYSTGLLDATALAAALVATGLTPAQVAAWTSYAALSKAGNLRWAYGLQLSPDGAAGLKARVSALNDQAKKSLITLPAYIAALTSLGIPTEWINALTAKTAATISGKGAQILIPTDLAPPF